MISSSNPSSPGPDRLSFGKSSPDEDVLRPDPGTEADFEVVNNPFAFSPGQLNKLFNPKSLPAFVALGGLQGIQDGLRTSATAGLSMDENSLTEQRTLSSSADQSAFTDRIRIFKKNVLPAKKPTSLLTLMRRAYNDRVLLLLTAAAVISLALGLYETFGAEHEPGAPTPVDWVEGLAICIAIVIVVGVGSLNDWQKERAFVRLNQRKEDREVKVLRSGKSIMINIVDILVGDVLHMEPGDIIPADGISSVDRESSATSQAQRASPMHSKRPAETMSCACSEKSTLMLMISILSSSQEPRSSRV